MNSKFKNVILISVFLIIILGCSISNLSNASMNFRDREIFNETTEENEIPMSINRTVGRVVAIVQYFCGIIGVITLIRSIYMFCKGNLKKGIICIIISVIFFGVYLYIHMLRYPISRIAG